MSYATLQVLRCLGPVKLRVFWGAGNSRLMQKMTSISRKRSKNWRLSISKMFFCFTPWLQHGHLKGSKDHQVVWLIIFHHPLTGRHMEIQLPQQRGCDLKLGEHCSKPRLVVLYRGWNPTQLYRDYIKPWNKDPVINQSGFHGMRKRGWKRDHNLDL